MSVLSYLTSLAEELKIQDWERTRIDTSIAVLSGKLGKHFTNISSKFVFGSYDRKTILRRSKDGNSDVDYMVVFADGVNYQPQTLITRLKNFAEMNYAKNEIYQSHPTIVLELDHIKFELVPAYQNWMNTYIPAPSNHYDQWIAATPNAMKAALNTKNAGTYYLIRKLVRILKYWNTIAGKVYTSYDLENYVLNTSFYGCYNLKDCFYAVLANLPVYSLSLVNKYRLGTLKEHVSTAKALEYQNLPMSAEEEIRKIFV